LVADFSRWLKEEQVGITGLTPEHAKRYLQILSQRRCLRRGDACTLRRLLELLSQRCVIPSTTASSQATPIGRITEDYTSYLRQQRNLSDATVVGYLPFIRRFLMDRFGPGPIDFSALCAADVIGFISRQAACLIAKRAKTATSALRSFLGYLRYRGEIQCDLAAVVPTVPIWSMTGIPRAIATSDANAALAHCRRDTPVGCRDYAILLLLARLGLRAGEIVSLTLDSMNWAGETPGLLGLRTPGHVSAQDPPARRPPHSTSGAAHPQHVRQSGGPRGVIALPRGLASCLKSPGKRTLCNDRVDLQPTVTKTRYPRTRYPQIHRCERRRLDARTARHREKPQRQSPRTA
jgi:hypothetical protein